jgi:uncharacterized Fe-S cluster-containing radical SAM superfamily protein
MICYASRQEDNEKIERIGLLSADTVGSNFLCSQCVMLMEFHRRHD